MVKIIYLIFKQKIINLFNPISKSKQKPKDEYADWLNNSEEAEELAEAYKELGY